MKTENELRGLGLKATSARVAVLELFRAHAASHYSAEDIYRLLLEQDIKIGLATVYRALDQLAGAGILSRQDFDAGRAVYEFNVGEHHDHLVCISCGRVTEFTDALIENRQQEVARLNGYQMSAHQLVLFGTCADCEHFPRKTKAGPMRRV